MTRTVVRANTGADSYPFWMGPSRRGEYDKHDWPVHVSSESQSSADMMGPVPTASSPPAPRTPTHTRRGPRTPSERVWGCCPSALDSRRPPSTAAAASAPSRLAVAWASARAAAARWLCCGARQRRHRCRCRLHPLPRCCWGRSLAAAALWSA